MEAFLEHVEHALEIRRGAPNVLNAMEKVGAGFLVRRVRPVSSRQPRPRPMPQTKQPVPQRPPRTSKTTKDPARGGFDPTSMSRAGSLT